jgi:predicted transcriptional regulator
MESHNLNLTNLETQVMEAFINGLYAEAGFSDIDATDLSSWTKIPKNSIRGVISSLVQKGIISIDGNSSGYQIIYLNPGYWYLHPEWKNEKPYFTYGEN